MTTNNGTSGWVEQFLTVGDDLYRGGQVANGQVGVRLCGDIELTDRPHALAQLGRELHERFSGNAFAEGVKAPQVLITGNPVDGFHFYGPTPLEDTADGYRAARTRMLEERDGVDWWTAPLLPLSVLEPIDGDDQPPTPATESAADRGRRVLQALRLRRDPIMAIEIADLIADLLHLAAEEGHDPDYVAGKAMDYYQIDNPPQRVVTVEPTAEMVAHTEDLTRRAAAVAGEREAYELRWSVTEEYRLQVTAAQLREDLELAADQAITADAVPADYLAGIEDSSMYFATTDRVVDDVVDVTPTAAEDMPSCGVCGEPATREIFPELDDDNGASLYCDGCQPSTIGDVRPLAGR